MSAPERAMWEALRPHLSALNLDPVRVENGLGRGTPDVNYTRGWIELKHAGDWPKRPTTPVALPHLKANQVAWIRRRWAAGGPAWVMVKVSKEWFLFAGADASDLRAGLTADEMRDRCCWASVGKLADPSIGYLKAWLLWDAPELLPGSQARLYRLQCGKTVEEVAEALDTTKRAVVDTERGYSTPMLNVNDLIDYWLT